MCYGDCIAAKGNLNMYKKCTNGKWKEKKGEVGEKGRQSFALERGLSLLLLVDECKQTLTLTMSI